MAHGPDVRCPICGAGDWRTVLSGSGFRIDRCASGCIARTVPPPEYSPDLPPGAKAENLTQADRRESGHFTFADQILDLVSRFQPGGRLLDIGSGWGQLLRSALDRGYDAVGVEASAGAAELAREAFDVESVVGCFPDYEFQAGSFDAVVMNHVLEHLPEPMTALSEVERILKLGGVLAVMAPNFDSLARAIRSEKWYGLQPSQHVWQLSVRSIRELMLRAGLRPAVVRHSSLDYKLAARPRLNRLRLWLALTAARALRMGDNVIVIATKPAACENSVL